MSRDMIAFLQLNIDFFIQMKFSLSFLAFDQSFYHIFSSSLFLARESPRALGALAPALRVQQAEQPAEARADVGHQREVLVRAQLALLGAVGVREALRALAHGAAVQALRGSGKRYFFLCIR